MAEESGFYAWMENKFMPVAMRIANVRLLVAIRDAFVSILPITMIGSFATLLNVFFRDLPNVWFGEGNAFTAACSELINIDGLAYNGSLSVLSLVFAFALGYHMTRTYEKEGDVNPFAGGVITFAAVVCTMNFSASFDYTLPNVAVDAVPTLTQAGLEVVEGEGIVTLPVTGGGLISTSLTGSTGLFAALIFGLLSSWIYVKITLAKLTIKLPEGVPPMVSKAFAAIIPGVVAVYICAIITQLCVIWTGQYPGPLISTLIQQPLLGFSQNAFAIILVNFLIQFFWFFGIHGSNVLAPVTNGVYLPALMENMNAYNSGTAPMDLPYKWVSSSYEVYTWIGGAGITLGLIIAVLIYSKREDYRVISGLALPMGIFNINEPIIFGIPIVLNPLYFIPWMIIPPICTILPLILTFAGVIPPVFLQVPWIMPAGIGAFLATGGNLLAGLVSLSSVVISFLIWIPFIRLANKETSIEIEQDEEYNQSVGDEL